MRHPNPAKQKEQEDFLLKCPEADREFHARLFRIGNAAYCYHQLAAETSDANLKGYFQEWLQGLSASISFDMQQHGFEKCKTMLPFTRYVNERNDNGMRDWMKEHLSEEDFRAFNSPDEIEY